MLDEYYGTPVPEALPGRDVVLEIDVQGASQILDRCADVVCVLLVPPSLDEQEVRLRGRGDPDEHVRQRLALGEHELEAGKALADVVVVNDDLDRTVAELAAIVDRARRTAG